MEVKEASAKYSRASGYKHTEVGVIPEDWDVSPLEEFTSFISYGFTNPMPTSVSGVYMITAKDIYNGRIQFDTARSTTEEAYRTLLTAKSRPKKGDLLLTKDGTLGRLALVDERTVCINQSVAILRPNTKASPQFLKILLEAPAYQSRMIEDAGGSTIKHIYITIVNRMPLAVPPTKAEQEAIAEALSDADALIESLEQLLVKKRHLKQGAMQQLLTGKKRLPGFSGEWEVKRLGDVASLYQPLTISAHQFTAAGYPVYGANGVVGFFDKFNHDSWQVTVTCRGSTCGTVNRTVEKCWITGNAMVVNCEDNKEVNKNFLYYLLTLQDLTICITGTGQPQIVRTPLANFELNIPSDVTEQTAIATLLSDMDAELAALETKLAKARNLKQGMMQELLTGRIRLV